jgi:hypothetical protein
MTSYGPNRQAIIDWIEQALATAPPTVQIQQDFVIKNGVQFMSKLTITSIVPISPYALKVPRD